MYRLNQFNPIEIGSHLFYLQAKELATLMYSDLSTSHVSRENVLVRKIHRKTRTSYTLSYPGPKAR